MKIKALKGESMFYELNTESGAFEVKGSDSGALVKTVDTETEAETYCNDNNWVVN